MVQASYIQTSFGSGEWSKTMQGRMDRPDYRQAMARCYNGLPIETEGWTRRPGTLQGGLTRGGAAGRVIPFVFKESAPYNMEFTDGYLRFWNGLSRVTANDDKAISSISGASPAVIATTLSHGWSTGDQVFFKSLGTPDGYLLGRLFTMTSTGAASMTLVDAVTGVALNGSVLQTFTSGTLARVKDIATSYTASAWQGLRVVQTERKAILLSASSPQVLSQVTDPGGNTFATFSLAGAGFKDGPYLDPPPGAIVTPSAKVGNILLTFAFTAYDATVSYSIGDYASNAGHNYKSLQNTNLNNTPAVSPTYWQEVTGGDPVGSTGFTAADIGRHIRLLSEPLLWVAGTTYAAKDVVAYSSTGVANTYWVSLVGSNTGNIPGQDATKWAVVAGTAYALWSWGRVTAVSGSGIISGALAGSTNIGGMTTGGGLAGAFDGTNAKAASASAESAAASSNSTTSYVGKNYSGASDQTIASATVYPSTDYGFNTGRFGFLGSQPTITLNLRAKASAPASSSDGTLLGTSGAFINSLASVTIASNDTTTALKYVWIEVITTLGASVSNQNVIAQVVLYTPNVANGSVVTLQIAGPPLLYTSAIRTWRAGAYTDSLGWPRCGTYHEGRLWLSGSIPNRFDASVSNDIFNFAPTNPDGSVSNSSGISYTLNSPDVNAIFWLVPRQEGIIAGTQAGEWLIQATAANTPLTPFSIQAHRYTSIKCANIEPAVAEHTVVLVQKHRRRLMEYFADVFSGKFAAPCLTFKAKHLMAGGVAEIRFQQDSMPVVWMRMADNTLKGLTYKRDSLISKDGPTIAAMHWHTLGSARTVESLAVGPSDDAGELEALSMVTSDGTYRYVEIMSQPFEDEDDLSDARFVDGALTPSVYVAGASSVVIYGLWAYNGVALTLVCGGLNCGSFTPSNGTVTIPYGDGVSGGAGSGLFTEDFVNSFDGVMPILAGYTYASQGQLVRPNTPQESGARQGPAFAKVKRSHRLGALLVNTLSRSISFGTTFTKLKPAILKTKNGPEYTVIQPFTGIYKESLQDGGDPLDSMLAWEATGVGPCTVAVAGAFLDTEDE